jgi:hypothetical protein
MPERARIGAGGPDRRILLRQDRPNSRSCHDERPQARRNPAWGRLGALAVRKYAGYLHSNPFRFPAPRLPWACSALSSTPSTLVRQLASRTVNASN